MASCTTDKRGFFNQPHGHFSMFRDTETYTSIYIRQNLTKTWRMRMQLLPGLIFAGSDIKAKIRPGIEARAALDRQWHYWHHIVLQRQHYTPIIGTLQEYSAIVLPQLQVTALSIIGASAASPYLVNSTSTSSVCLCVCLSWTGIIGGPRP